ncbi:retron Ec67 family RNA-directed DNA polymerase/endonuclease [Bradyrhizobium sp. RT3b]|uniref:retron Ec67 family RNA-directed DNA polymerase/endonuclease n=1 Tax=Bradyrhizobium sp. RT3b TaxID=3156334 RepID=UPI00339787BA
MSVLDDLRKATTRHHVAAILNYKPSALSYVLYKLAPAEKYETFTIKKKSGGDRKIDSPTPLLKGVQKKLADVLYKCLEEVEADDGFRNELSHAFRHGYSIITNAKAHRSRRYVLNLDLAEFFPSLNFGRVRGFFIQNNNFKLAEPVATVLAQIACKDGVLPQGSPCSPVISELMTHFLDMRLVRLASRNKCYYTRYADDITFSTNLKQFPVALAVPAGSSWQLGDELRSRIIDAGFKINDGKTRMQVRASRQTVTGLTVNKKVNVPQEYYKRARAMVHSFLTTGTYDRYGVRDTSVQRLEGVLNHVYHIRERLIDLAIEGEKSEEKRHRLHADRTKQKNEYPSAIRAAYYRLVFFKHFIDPPKPLVVCEGPTDVVYLKCAIRSLAGAHPKLASPKDGKISVALNFFKYSDQSKDLLQLRGGSSDLKFFLEAWRKNLGRYKHRPMMHPVIILIDNDDGANDIFKLLQSKKKFGLAIGHAMDDPFYHLGDHLYLVKTPAKGADHKSCPEDFFEQKVRDTKVDGKVFNPNKEHDAPGEYGKVVFAEKVVRPQAHIINFSGFDPLLARFDAVIGDYAKRKEGALAAPASARAPALS